MHDHMDVTNRQEERIIDVI